MEADTTRRDGRRRWLAAGTLCLTPFLMVLMFQGAQVALPAVQRGLHLSAAELQWVVSANTLAFGLLLLPAGRVGDLVGHRRLFCLGMGVVALASLACGLAQDPAVLIAARAVQGVGAAMATPSALALLTAAFQVGPARNLALGVWGAAGPIGGIVGLAAGGLLAATLGWSAVFLCAAPPAALALLLGRVLLDDHRPPAAARRLDIRGLVGPGWDARCW